MSYKLLVDGDILVYRACAAVEKEAEFGDVHVLYSKFEDAKSCLEAMLAEFEDHPEVSEVVFAFTGSDNYRYKVDPTYKSNRKGTRKPLALSRLRDYVVTHYETICEDKLEADDLMGIYADEEGWAIWTLDKDLKQCPGTHLIDDEMVEIDFIEGSAFHMKQTLMGDAVDGYPGCPGIGEAKAETIVNTKMGVKPYEHVMKRGPRKGETEIRYEDVVMPTVWEAVVSHFEANGLTEDDAKVQATLAYILRLGDYCFDTKRIKRWKPLI